MKKLLPLILILFFIGFHADAQVSYHAEVDELNNKTSHYITIYSNDHERYTAENYLLLICHPSGTYHLQWHKGGRFTGGTLRGYTKIQYKFDNGVIISTTMDELSDPNNLKTFIEEIIASNKLIAKSEFDPSSDTFNLTGTANAFKPFHEQCLNNGID